MNNRRECVRLNLSVALVLGACGTADDRYYEDMEYRSDGGILIDSGGGLAGDDGTAVEANKRVPRGADGGGWLDNGLEDPVVSGVDPDYALDTDLGLSPDGLLLDSDYAGTAAYLVECALAAGDSLVKTVDGETLTFYGQLGLAPGWKTGSCDEDCQQWVSACLLARTNVNNETVTVWVQADHPSIGFGLPTGAVLEAGWFGNLFAADDEKFYCKGESGGSVAAMREGRSCSWGPNDCEFTKLNACTGRCDLVGPQGDVPAACVAGNGSSVSDSYRTISTYIVP